MIINDSESTDRILHLPGGHPVGFYAVDPGETTGVYWAVVSRDQVGRLGAHGAVEYGVRKGWAGYGQFYVGNNDSSLTMREVFAAREVIRHMNDRVSELIVHKGIDRLAETTDRLVPTLPHGVASENSWRFSEMIIEDFILRERTMSKSLLSPVRMAARLETLLEIRSEAFGIPLQQPSSAKSVVTDERMRRWGLWIKGQQHARDACRHLILRLRVLYDG